jgi:Fe-Mn family superoxide dismutase
MSADNIKDIKLNEDDLVKTIRESLGLPTKEERTEKALHEAYVTQAKKFDLRTELLSNKNKRAHLELMDGYIESLNQISAQLDAVDRATVNANSSEFRSLKLDEVYNINGSFLHGMFFENISDLQSQLTMDTLTFMRLERDFGSFDDWQKDFIACAISARNGWALTVYNSHLNRFVNVVVDSHNQNIPISSFPIIVLDMWEHSYYRDYLKDKKTYVHAMMKELDWETIEARVKKADRIAKVMH